MNVMLDEASGFAEKVAEARTSVAALLKPYTNRAVLRRVQNLR